MSAISNIKNRLNKPYPGPKSYATEVKGLIWAGLIIFLLLFLFRPFGMGRYEGSLLLMTLGFGGVAVIRIGAGCINHRLFLTAYLKYYY